MYRTLPVAVEGADHADAAIAIAARLAAQDDAELVVLHAIACDTIPEPLRRMAEVVGSRGLGGLKGLMLGSAPQSVNDRAPCTCIAVHRRAATAPEGAKRAGPAGRASPAAAKRAGNGGANGEGEPAARLSRRRDPRAGRAAES